MNEFDTTPFFPILDGKVLDIYMSSTFSRKRWIDNQDGGCIVLVNRSRYFVFETKFMWNWLQIYGILCTRNCSKELGFSETNNSNGLCFETVYNGTIRLSKDKTSSRLSLLSIICISSVNKGHQLWLIDINRKRRYFFDQGQHQISRLQELNHFFQHIVCTWFPSLWFHVDIL